MRTSLRPRSVYDVFSAVACAVAVLGGTAYAAATITGADVVNESLTTSDIKNGSVYGGDIANDSISGYDVKESTLNLKPAAVSVAAAVTSGTDACALQPAATARFCGSDTGRWANFGDGYQPAGFFKDAFGVVHLRGSVAGRSGTGGIFILPTGYRPAYTQLFGVFDASSTASHSYIEVRPSGWVTYKGGGVDSTTYLSLDGISFKP